MRTMRKDSGVSIKNKCLCLSLLLTLLSIFSNTVRGINVDESLNNGTRAEAIEFLNSRGILPEIDPQNAPNLEQILDDLNTLRENEATSYFGISHETMASLRSWGLTLGLCASFYFLDDPLSRAHTVALALIFRGLGYFD